MYNHIKKVHLKIKKMNLLKGLNVSYMILDSNLKLKNNLTCKTKL